MRAQIVTVGPLAASVATAVATSQKAAAAQQLVLDGTKTDAAAGHNDVCASQTPAGAGNLTINGTRATGGVAYLGTPRRVYVVSAGNDSGITYTITGTSYTVPGMVYGVTETVTGSNASEVSTKNLFFTVTQVAVSGAAGGAVTVGMNGLATLDFARQVIITSGGADTGITFTISGTDWNGLPISEVLTGASGAAATSVLSYATVNSILTSGAVATTVTAGTNGVASSPWVSFDPAYTGLGPTSIQVSGTGTINWTVQQTLDDMNSTTNAVTPANMVWVNHADTNLVASAVATGVQGNYADSPVWARVVLNSGTGTVKATFIQNGMLI